MKKTVFALALASLFGVKTHTFHTNLAQSPERINITAELWHGIHPNSYGEYNLLPGEVVQAKHFETGYIFEGVITRVTPEECGGIVRILKRKWVMRGEAGDSWILHPLRTFHFTLKPEETTKLFLSEESYLKISWSLPAQAPVEPVETEEPDASIKEDAEKNDNNAEENRFEQNNIFS